MLPTLQIGPLAVQTPGLILLIGLWIGLYLSEKQAIKRGLDSGILYNLAFLVLISALIGARVAYVLQYPQAFLSNPLSSFSLNTTLLNLWGGIAVGFIAALWYGQRQRLDFWFTLDILTPTFATLGIFLGLANFASGSAFGTASNLPWAIELWGIRRHPTQVYETISACVGLGLIFRLLNSNEPPIKGIAFLVFLTFSSASRLFLEAFRGDSQLIGSFHTIQLVAWIILAACLWTLGKRLFLQSGTTGNIENLHDR
jgi:prolipoprotein diacylglyceryl transferase